MSAVERAAAGMAVERSRNQQRREKERGGTVVVVVVAGKGGEVAIRAGWTENSPLTAEGRERETLSCKRLEIAPPRRMRA